MTFIRIARVLDTIKNDSRRIKRSPQRPAMNAIDEGRAIASHSLHLAQVRQLLDQAITHFVIGIQRQSPFGFDLGKTEVALIGEVVERPLEQRYLRIAREDIERPILLPLSTTTMRRAQASLSSVRAILGASSNVMMSGVMASINRATCL